jgi:hypothetical protein
MSKTYKDRRDFDREYERDYFKRKKQALAEKLEKRKAKEKELLGRMIEDGLA